MEGYKFFFFSFLKVLEVPQSTFIGDIFKSVQGRILQFFQGHLPSQQLLLFSFGKILTFFKTQPNYLFTNQLATHIIMCVLAGLHRNDLSFSSPSIIIIIIIFRSCAPQWTGLRFSFPPQDTV